MPEPLVAPQPAPGDPQWARELKELLVDIVAAINGLQANRGGDGVTTQNTGGTLTAVKQWLPIKITAGPDGDDVYTADVYGAGTERPATISDVRAVFAGALPLDPDEDIFRLAQRVIQTHGATKGEYWELFPDADGVPVVVKITAITDATTYTVSVYGNGYYEDGGSVKSATETGKQLRVFNREDLKMRVADILVARKVDTHYEVDGRLDLSYLPAGGSGDDNDDLFLRGDVSGEIQESYTLPDIVKDSIEAESGQLHLDGDEETPTNGKVYARFGGNKGWFTLAQLFTLLADYDGGQVQFVQNDNGTIQFKTAETCTTTTTSP